MEQKIRMFAAICYITWIGFAVTIIFRDKNSALIRRHLNQALILNWITMIATFLIGVGGLFSVIGVILDSGALILSLIGIVRALRQSDRPIPFIGNVELLR